MAGLWLVVLSFKTVCGIFLFDLLLFSNPEIFLLSRHMGLVQVIFFVRYFKIVPFSQFFTLFFVTDKLISRKGINSSFGVYLSFYLNNNYFPGATSLEFAFIGGLSVSIGLGIAPISNYLAKRWHYKVPMVIGTFFLAFGQIFAGLSKKIWQLFLTQGVMFGTLICNKEYIFY